jgi:hypothetical protein
MKNFRIVAFALAAFPAFGDTLLRGAIYFDSEATIQKVVSFSLSSENEKIGDLIKAGKISEPTLENREIEILTSGPDPQSPAEFRFTDEPPRSAPRWTLTKYLAVAATVAAPSPSPSPSPGPSPIPEKKKTPPVEHREISHRYRHIYTPPFASHNRRRPPPVIPAPVAITPNSVAIPVRIPVRRALPANTVTLPANYRTLHDQYNPSNVPPSTSP